MTFRIAIESFKKNTDGENDLNLFKKTLEKD